MGYCLMASCARPMLFPSQCPSLYLAKARLILSNSSSSRSTSHSTPGSYPIHQHHHAKSDLLRYAVREQTRAFRDYHLEQDGVHICPVTGQLLTLDNTEVDHCGPMFKDLVQGWLHQQGFTSLSELKTIKEENGSLRLPRKRSWQRYHLQHAKLRLISTEGHRQINKQQQQEQH